MLQAERDKQAKAGYAVSTRGPLLADKRWSGELKFIPVADSMDRVPLCVAMRKSDGDLKVEIDRVLAELARSGRLPKVFARWHVPYTPPNEGEGPSS